MLVLRKIYSNLSWRVIFNMMRVDAGNIRRPFNFQVKYDYHFSFLYGYINKSNSKVLQALECFFFGVKITQTSF